jgi:hypothetical protein
LFLLVFHCLRRQQVQFSGGVASPSSSRWIHSRTSCCPTFKGDFSVSCPATWPMRTQNATKRMRNNICNNEIAENIMSLLIHVEGVVTPRGQRSVAVVRTSKFSPSKSYSKFQTGPKSGRYVVGLASALKDHTCQQSSGTHDRMVQALSNTLTTRQNPQSDPQSDQKALSQRNRLPSSKRGNDGGQGNNAHGRRNMSPNRKKRRLLPPTNQNPKMNVSPSSTFSNVQRCESPE